MSLSWLSSTLYSYISRDSSQDDSPHIEIDDVSLPLDHTSNSDPESQPNSPVKGLENLGNTCFFNASVQALLACPKFVQYITVLSNAYKQNTSHSEFTPYEPSDNIESQTHNKSNANKIFCELLLDLYNGTITSPKDLFAQLCAFHPTEFSSFTQSDAHESFNKMMEILEIEQLYIMTESQSETVIDDMFQFINEDEQDEKEEKEDIDIDITNIQNPFHGLLESTLECASCRYSNERRQTSFRCLSLSLSDISNLFEDVYSVSSVTLTDRIAAFEIEEPIEGYRCMLCEYKGFMHQLNLKLDSLKRTESNEMERIILQQQYHELNEKLNALNGCNKNGKIQNGYNGYYANDDKNGYLQDKMHYNISAKQRRKYEMDCFNVSYRTIAKKKQFVSRYPSVLCIHLNRLQFGAKDSRYVSFKPFLSLNDDKMSMYNHSVMFNENDCRLCSQYILMSVIVHHGSDSGGHYTIYKRNINIPKVNIERLEWKSLEELQWIETYSEWYHISDEFVNKVTINEVLICRAYMLFYQKNQFSFK